MCWSKRSLLWHLENFKGLKYPGTVVMRLIRTTLLNLCAMLLILAILKWIKLHKISPSHLRCLQTEKSCLYEHCPVSWLISFQTFCWIIFHTFLRPSLEIMYIACYCSINAIESIPLSFTAVPLVALLHLFVALNGWLQCVF